VETALDAPLSITVLGADQIGERKLRGLTDLAVSMPNVALDDVGTTRGVANFSMRGLGINSSIPSIDPTVGVFVDGVYLGMTFGAALDMFGMESIEVLRGPQGILFGRNVTGGAILVNTRKPGDEFEARVRAALDGGGDGGLNKYLMGSAGGPVSDSLSVGVTAYYNDDDGWFDNAAPGGGPVGAETA
jgi:iron complex outermembrane receptor protein